MRPGRTEPRGCTPTGSGCVLGMAAALTLGACGLETIAGPEEASEAPHATMDGKEKAEAPTAAADEAPEGSSRAIFACRIPSLRMSAEDLPLVMVDGVRPEHCYDARPEHCFDAIAALDIESFKIIRASDAVEAYGEDGENGAILIFTRQPDERGKGGGTPGGPSG